MMHITSRAHRAAVFADADKLRIVFLGFLFSLFVIGCSSIPISYYDATTYKNLTSLKAETVLLVEKFDTNEVSTMEEKIDQVTLKMRQAYEYELGKGQPNSDTASQFKKIIELYESDVSNYRGDGPGALGPKFFLEAAKVLGQAFDIAIATENLKNKDKH